MRNEELGIEDWGTAALREQIKNTIDDKAVKTFLCETLPNSASMPLKRVLWLRWAVFWLIGVILSF
jgi:hypothetical protein